MQIKGRITTGGFDLTGYIDIQVEVIEPGPGRLGDWWGSFEMALGYDPVRFLTGPCMLELQNGEKAVIVIREAGSMVTFAGSGAPPPSLRHNG